MSQAAAWVWRQAKRLFFRGSGSPQSAHRQLGWSIGNPDARHPYAIGPEHPAASRWFNALEFHATFQLRTPKRILERNGTIIPLSGDPPSDFEPWMGVWFPVDTDPNILAQLAPKAWAEMEANRTVASDAGPVKPAEYLPFLIAFRTLVEDQSATIGERMARIAALFQRPQWTAFAVALGGPERVCDRFFPTVLSRISGLPQSSRAALSSSGIRTVAALTLADDQTLMGVKGIGPTKLAAIRQFCAAFEGDPQAERLIELAL